MLVTKDPYLKYIPLRCMTVTLLVSAVSRLLEVFLHVDVPRTVGAAVTQAVR